jgi:Holliday junction resolvase RusA-like endonuclease
VTDLFIPGVPVPQGSKKPGRVFYKDGKPRASVIDDNGPALKAWRAAAALAIRDAYPGLTAAGPLFAQHVPAVLSVRFVFPLRGEDKATIRRAERAITAGEEGQLIHEAMGDPFPSCRTGCVHLPWHTVKPDKDKCLRALFDVLTLGHVWADDGQCCRFDVLAYRGPVPGTWVRWAIHP